MKVSKRIQNAPVSGIRKMFDLARSDSINLGIGEPDNEPPALAIKGMCEATQQGRNKYSATAGVRELKEAVAKHYSKYAEFSERNVIITPSGSTAIFEAAMALIDPGDEILCPSPAFVIYAPLQEMMGGKNRFYHLTEGDYQPDIDHIQSLITKDTTMLVLTNPSNPTGAVIGEETYKALCDISDDNDITILSDEVYDSFVYEGKHLSFMNRLDRSVVIGGFSKMMAVTGWRLGFMVANEDMITNFIKAQYFVSASPGMPAMYGALKALPTIEPYLEKTRKLYKARRDLIVKRINEIDGMHLQAPKGAFYAFPSYDRKIKSEDLAMECIKEGLICTPGVAFGPEGEYHLRFSYAASEEKIDKGMDILEKVMKKVK